MADKGFQMPPSQRREPKQFEPPPWERDAFEELQRRREEEGATAVGDECPTAEEEGGRPTEDVDAAVSKPVTRPEQDASAATGNVPPQGSVGSDELNESMVEAMLLQLAAEEPREDRAISTVQLWVSIALYGLAVPLIIWGMAALVGARETGMTGMVSGFVLLVFGAGSIAGAIYLTVKSLQKRGVL